MDWTSMLGNSPLSFMLPQPGQPTSGAPGAPTNILPPQAQTSPTGILNGAQPPQTQQQQNGQQMLMAQAQKLMAPPAAPPQMGQLQMAKPLGSQGIDPTKLLAAMKSNQLMNA